MIQLAVLAITMRAEKEKKGQIVFICLYNSLSSKAKRLNYFLELVREFSKETG